MIQTLEIESHVQEMPIRELSGKRYVMLEMGEFFEIPEGYVTGDEFAKRVKEGLIRRFKAEPTRETAIHNGLSCMIGIYCTT